MRNLKNYRFWPQGEILFNSWKDMFTGAGAPFPVPPRIYSFDGRNVLADSTWPQKVVWHGADRFGVRNIDGYCDAWNSNQRHRFGIGSSLTRGKLLDQEKYSCNNPFIVLCIEVSSQDDLSWSPKSKRDTSLRMMEEELERITNHTLNFLPENKYRLLNHDNDLNDNWIFSTYSFPTT